MEKADGPRRVVRREEITPVLLTCAQNLPFVEQFVTSYVEHVGRALPGPVIVIDLTMSLRLLGSYCDLLNRLGPVAVYVHPRPAGVSDYDSVQDAAFFALSCGLAEMGSREYLLFLEDDVIFSSEFVASLDQLKLDSDAGFYTFYQPGGGYGGTVIEPYRFYGTQCLLFRREVVELLLKSREAMERQFSPGYDHRWAQFLGSCQFRLYASPRSYVQHVGVASRIGSGYHSSCTFVP